MYSKAAAAEGEEAFLGALSCCPLLGVN